MTAARERKPEKQSSLRHLAEARVLEIRGSFDAPGFEACVKAEMEIIRRKRKSNAQPKNDPDLHELSPVWKNDQ